MSLAELILVAVSLAMDCFSVSMATGIMQKRWMWASMTAMALCFGLFQGLMPLAGWFCFVHFSSLIESADHWVAFGMLAFLGGKMVRDGLRGDCEEHNFNPASPWVILSLSVATSIDALAVGVTFSCLDYKTPASLLLPASVIGAVSVLFSLLGLAIGIGLGCKVKSRLKPELLGGTVLIAIGLKILAEHTGWL